MIETHVRKFRARLWWSCFAIECGEEGACRQGVFWLPVIMGLTVDHHVHQDVKVGPGNMHGPLTSTAYVPSQVEVSPAVGSGR